MFKIILADNQAVFRAGTAKILAMEDDFRIIAQCQDAERLYHALDAFRNSVLIFTSTLKLDVPQLMDRCQRSGCRTIVVLEVQESPRPWLEQGVQGILYRSVSGSVLMECVRKVATGEAYLQHALDVMVRHQNEDEVGARVRDRLTPKEMKIVALIVQGCKNKEMALFIIHHKMLAEAAEAVGNEMMAQMY